MIATHVVNPMYVATMGFISQNPINLATDGFINWTYDPVVIYGSNPVIKGSIHTYWADPISIGSTLAWTIIGGNIISTSDNTIVVQWFTTGALSVIETNIGLNYISPEIFYNVIVINNVNNGGGDGGDDFDDFYTLTPTYNDINIENDFKQKEVVSIEDISNSISNIISNENIDKSKIILDNHIENYISLEHSKESLEHSKESLNISIIKKNTYNTLIKDILTEKSEFQKENLGFTPDLINPDEVLESHNGILYNNDEILVHTDDNEEYNVLKNIIYSNNRLLNIINNDDIIDNNISDNQIISLVLKKDNKSSIQLTNFNIIHNIKLLDFHIE
jgi:hypothetical protein